MIVSALDPGGDPSGDVFLTETRNDAGEFDVVLESGGFVALEGSGYYFDEVGGRLSTSTLTLRGLYVATGQAAQSARINAVTHLARPRALKLVADGAAPRDAIETAEQELVASLGIGPDGFELSQQGTDLDLLGADTDDNAYVFAVSAILLGTALSENPGSPDAALQELLNTVGEELRTTGTLSEGTRQRLDQGESTLVVPTVMANMQQRLLDVGRNDAPPQLGRMIDGDHDGFMFVDDCDDHGATVHPEGQEVCGAADEDCDGLVDDEDPSVDLATVSTFYVDADHDGFGTSAVTALRCTPDVDWSANDSDCDDADGAIHPGAIEIWYDGVDQDCDDHSDFDADFDGHDVGANADCDDTSAVVHPQADELCDGVDNGCLADWTSAAEAGLAAWQPASGDRQDVTPLVTGSPSEPALYTIESPGTLRFCDGWFDVRVVAEAAATIESMNGAELTTLSARDSGSVITVQTGIPATVRGLTLRDGSGTPSEWEPDDLLGGGIYAEGSLVVEDSVLTANSAYLGSAIFQQGALTIASSTIEFNEGPATIYVSQGGATIEDSDISDNGGTGVFSEGQALTVRRTHLERNSLPGSSGGGGIRAWRTVLLEDVDLVDNEISLSLVEADATVIRTHISGNKPAFWTMYLNQGSSLEFVDSVLSDNTANGELVYMHDSTFACVDSAIVRNIGANSIFTLYGFDESISSVGCDWGSGDDDNAPSDIRTRIDNDVYVTYDYGADATFACVDGVCAP